MNKQRFFWIMMLTALILFLFAGALLAQSGGGYDMSRWSVDAGGGRVSAGAYEIAGAIGQADAHAALSDGNYSLTGGFWSGDAAAMRRVYLPMLRE